MATNKEIEEILKDAKLTETQIAEYWKEKTGKESKEKQDKKYYLEHFEEIVVAKIDEEEELTDEDLLKLREFVVEHNVIELCGRYFMLKNGFYNQPYEVSKKTYEKTITVTKWEKI